MKSNTIRETINKETREREDKEQLVVKILVVSLKAGQGSRILITRVIPNNLNIIQNSLYISQKDKAIKLKNLRQARVIRTDKIMVNKEMREEMKNLNSIIIQEEQEASREEAEVAKEIMIGIEIPIYLEVEEAVMQGVDTETIIKERMWRKTLTIQLAIHWRVMTWRISTKIDRIPLNRQTLNGIRTISRMTKKINRIPLVVAGDAAEVVEEVMAEVHKTRGEASTIKRAKI